MPVMDIFSQYVRRPDTQGGEFVGDLMEHPMPVENIIAHQFFFVKNPAYRMTGTNWQIYLPNFRYSQRYSLW